jgi:hypothetical protein
MIKKEVSKAKSFYGFSWKKFILGFKKPAIMLLTIGITTIVAQPELGIIIAGLGGIGIVVERIWALVEFFLKEVEL